MKSKVKRALGIITSIVLIVVLLMAGSFYFLKKDLAKPLSKSVVKPALADELKKMIIEASDSLYHLQFSYFDINPDSGTGIIRNLKLIPDSAVYQKLVLQKKAPNSIFTVSLDSLVITHFSFQKTSDGRKLVIDDIVVQNPSLAINYTLQPYSDSINHKEEKTLLKTMKNLMKFCSIQNFTMRNLTLSMVNRSNYQTRITSLKHLNITTGGINVVTVKNNDSSGKESTAISVQFNRIAMPDSLYYLDTKGIRYIPQTATLSIKKTELLPRLSKDTFYKQAGFRKDRYHFIQIGMQCNGVDVDKLIKKQQIHVHSINVDSSYTEIYTDYHYAKRKPPVRNHADPHERLQKLAFDVTIDTMSLHNGTTEYAIKGEKSDDVAIMKVDKIENVITNITNNAEAKARSHFLVSKMVGRLMESGTIATTIRFDLADKNGAFTINSTIGKMDGTAFNALAKPLALMEIQSMNIQKMNTTINGNAYSGKGNIDLYYTNMKIALLKKKDDDYKKKKLLSFVTNIIAPDDNPNKRGKFKKGPINVKRNPTDSFFGFLWKCNLEGMAIHMMGLHKQ